MPVEFPRARVLPLGLNAKLPVESRSASKVRITSPVFALRILTLLEKEKSAAIAIVEPLGLNATEPVTKL